MLAQTQVARVAARFEAFLARFPSPGAMAAAGLGEVLVAWQGLGYPRRAARLHESARLITERHRGTVPADAEALRRLPGVGEYVAAAVMAFAFDAPVLPVDVNVGRVLARAVAGRRLTPGAARETAAGVASEHGGRALAQAFMDLGASLCRSDPRCEACPLAGGGPGACAWHLSHETPSSFPDPSRGSAGASRRQAPFEGSDRQGRGRLLARAVRGPIAGGELADAAGWPGDGARAHRVAAMLVGEGLMVADGTGGFRLPQ